MNDNASGGTFIELTASIVSAYVSNNSVPASDLPALIGQVHSALTRVATPALATPPDPVVGTRSSQPASARLRSEAPEARAPEFHPAAGPSAVDVPAAAGERLHSSIPRAERPEPSIVADDDEVPLSPNGAAPLQTQRPRSVEAASPDSTEDHAGGAAVEALRASRLDFLFRSKPARPASQRENFDAVWPSDARPDRSTESGPSPAAEAGQRQADQALPAQACRPEPILLEEPSGGAAAILKSGVVDGMAYTLYADGSIEAKLPHGTVRFGSIAELRAHIESKS